MQLKLFNTTVFLITFACLVNAQKDGDYIISKSNDTLFGEIFLPANTLREVQFRGGDSKKFTTYKPEEIIGYLYNGAFVKSCAIVQKGSSEVDNLYLLSVVQGAASLYHVQNSQTFYLEKNGEFHLLEKKDRLIDGKQLDDRRFAGILKALFSDCTIPDKKYEEVQFTIQSLTELVKTYNKCRDPNISYKSGTGRSLFTFAFGVEAGVAMNQTTTNVKKLFPRKIDGYSVKYSVGVDVAMGSSILSNLHFRPGVYLTQKEGGYQEQFSQDYVLTHISFNYVQFPLRLEYVFVGKKISPMFSAGYLTSIAIKNEKEVTKIYRTSGQTYFQEKTELYKPYEGGFVGSAGVMLNVSKKLHPLLEYQFEKTKVAFDDGYVLTTHKLLLGVRF
ncbi:MAG: outer membrane beta-barrel protein [Bacteroidetes bacterium]|nr:outer membrane beta-barrel protein [Bacteroidota bacterium]